MTLFPVKAGIAVLTLVPRLAQVLEELVLIAFSHEQLAGPWLKRREFLLSFLKKTSPKFLKTIYSANPPALK